MGNSVNSGLFLLVAGTAFLAEYSLLRGWYGRRRLLELVFFGAFANGAVWAACWGVWGLLHAVRPENYTILQYFLYVAMLGGIYGFAGLAPAALVAVICALLRKSRP